MYNEYFCRQKYRDNSKYYSKQHESRQLNIHAVFTSVQNKIKNNITLKI